MPYGRGASKANQALARRVGRGRSSWTFATRDVAPAGRGARLGFYPIRSGALLDSSISNGIVLTLDPIWRIVSRVLAPPWCPRAAALRLCRCSGELGQSEIGGKWSGRGRLKRAAGRQSQARGLRGHERSAGERSHVVFETAAGTSSS